MPFASSSSQYGSHVQALLAATAALAGSAALAKFVILPILDPGRAPASGRQSTTNSGNVAGKHVSASSVNVSYQMSPEMADAHGRVFGAELLKLVDVIAGVVSRKHTGLPCVTISVDRVIFLEQINVGDIVHFSASVNRAWGTSLEVGIRCVKEDKLGNLKYACHAYMTFVAKPPAVVPQSWYWNWSMASEAPRPQVPQIIPETLLEKKRYLLAGRRRGLRIRNRGSWDREMEHFRDAVLQASQETRTSSFPQDSISIVREEEKLRSLERELVVDAYSHDDPDVHVEDGWVIAEVKGFMEPIKFPLSEIEKEVKTKGGGAFRKIAMTRLASLDHLPDDTGTEEDLNQVLDVRQTHAVSLYIVRPQHCNSMNVLFGGQLLRWMEVNCAMSARHISSDPWLTASVDGMTFKDSAKPGEAVYLRSIVLRVWESSAEIYAIATAESVATPAPRFIGDAFFSMVSIDPLTGRPNRGHLKQVRVPPAMEFMVKEADKRKEERLEDRRLLQKVYG